MKTSYLALSAIIGLAILAAPTTASAADLQLPAPSPLARVMQTVGVTEITVEYSSPGVKGRKIFGKLVPNDELWRTGANSATKITFSKDVSIDGKPVPAGTYSIFTIPGKRSWTLILNKNADQGGTRKYDESLDQVRVTVKPSRLRAARERLTFVFSNTVDTGTRLDLEWDKTGVSLDIKVDTDALATAGIAKAQKSASRELASSARYMKKKKDLPVALKLIDASLAVQTDFYNSFIKARILNDMGDEAGAKKMAQQAWDLGEKAEYFFWKDQVAKALKGEW